MKDETTENPPKIIFLDIDGVLNVYGYKQYLFYYDNPNKDRKHTELVPFDEYGQIFEQYCVDNLKTLLEETGAKIVISSTWRHSGLNIMKEMWEKRKLPGEVIDITPSLNALRGNEIRTWLNEYRREHGIEIKDYVILDDDSDMLLWQQNRLVLCDTDFGLTHNRAYVAASILKGERY